MKTGDGFHRQWLTSGRDAMVRVCAGGQYEGYRQ